MKSYELIKEYPGSGKLGTIVNIEEMVNFPEYWKLVNDTSGFITSDGVKIYVGDTYFKISSNLTIERFKLPKHWVDNFKSDYKIFSSHTSALLELFSRIQVRCEDGVVNSENIPIYGVCTKGSWEVIKTDSFMIWRRNYSKEQDGVKNETSWLYFISEEERDSYQENNRPIYSKKHLEDVLNLRKRLTVQNPYLHLNYNL